MVHISPDVEQLVIDYLLDCLSDTEYSDVSVTAAVPNPRPEYFIEVRQTGATSKFPVFVDPVIGLDVWGATKEIASEIARVADGFLMDIDNVDGTQFYRTDSFAQLGYFPDPETGTPRYRSTYGMHTRKHVY